MRNVLIIAYFFPPMPEIGGVRLYGLAKYLPECGWNPIILTPVLPGEPDSRFQIIQTPYDDVIALWKRRVGLNPKETLNIQFNCSRAKNRPSIMDYLVYLPQEIIAYPDNQRGWYKHAVNAGNRILQSEQIDAILSSSSPVTCHLIAKTLAEKYHVPWVADLRDLWTQNHYSNHCVLRRFAEKRLELQTLGRSSALVTVSKPLADDLSRLHTHKPVYVITNGFDPDIVNSGSQISEKFAICYTGSIYNGYQDPEMLFEAVKQLIEEAKIDRKDIIIDFYGRDEGWLQYDIEKHGLTDVVRIHGMVPRDTALRNQRKSQILLLLTWNDPQEKGVYTGKVFEYLAAKRPILALGLNGGDVIVDLIQQTNVGVFASSVADVKETLLKWYHEYKSSGGVDYSGIQSEINKYSHREMAREFAEVFDEALGQTLRPGKA